MVESPEPHTLRIQGAITKIEPPHVALDVVSTVVPQARLASKLTELVTGKPAFVGEAQVETKITDAESGKILAEGVDRRVGGKKLDAAEFSS